MVPERPPKFVGIEELPKRVTRMAADVRVIKQFITEKCA